MKNVKYMSSWKSRENESNGRVTSDEWRMTSDEWRVASDEVITLRRARKRGNLRNNEIVNSSRFGKKLRSNFNIKSKGFYSTKRGVDGKSNECMNQMNQKTKMKYRVFPKKVLHKWDEKMQEKMKMT